MPPPLPARALPHASLAGLLVALAGCPFSPRDRTDALLAHAVALPDAPRTTVEQIGSLSFTTSSATEAGIAARDGAPGQAVVVFSLLGDLYRVAPTGGAAQKITSGPAFDSDPALSEDGSLLAFRSDRTGLPGIFTVATQGGDVHPLTVSAEHTHLLPIFSPDSRDIIYVRFRGANQALEQDWELMRQPAAGGPRQVLGVLPHGVTGLAITRSGQLYYAVVRPAARGGFESQLFLFPERSARQQVPGVLGALTPHPGGGLLARWQEADRGSAQHLVRLRPDSGEMEMLRALAPTSTLPRNDWLEGRNQLVVSDEGRLRLLRPDGSLAGEIGFSAAVEIEAQPRIGVMRNQPPRRHGRVLVREDLGLIYAAAGRIWFASSIPAVGRAEASPDGGAPMVPASGDAPISLSAEDEVAYDPALSTDGRTLLYVRLARAGAELVQIQLPANLRTDKPSLPGRRSVLYAAPGLSAPAFMRDSRSVVATAVDASGQARIVRIPIHGGAATTLRVPVGSGVSADPIPGGLCYSAPAWADDADRPWTREFVPGVVYRATEHAAAGQRLTALTSIVMSSACSPDGRLIALVYDGGVWVARLRGERPIRDGEGVRLAEASSSEVTTVGFTGSGKLMIIRAGEVRLVSVAEIMTEHRKGVPQDRIYLIPEEREARPHAPLWIEDISLIDPERRTITPHTTLVIDGRRVRFAGPREQAPPRFREAAVISGEQRYALPGLIDTHVRLGVYSPRAYLDYGVTTVLDLGGARHIDDVAAAAEAGHARGPSVVRTARLSSEPESVDISRAITAMAQLGASSVLIDEQLPRTRRRAAARMATDLGLRVAARGESVEGLVTSVVDGASLIVGQLAGDATYHDDLLALLSRSAVPVSSVLWPRGMAEQALRRGYPTRNVALFEHTVPEQAIAAHKALVFGRAQVPADAAQLFRAATTTALDLNIERKISHIMSLHHAGVRVVAGSGAGTIGCFPGVSLLWEIAALGRAGITPYDALRAATSEAARALGAADLGRLSVGARGDLVVLSGNPLDDLRRLEQVVLTVRDGQVHRPAPVLHSSVLKSGL